MNCLCGAISARADKPADSSRTNKNGVRACFASFWRDLSSVSHGWKRLYLLRPNSNAECNVMPLMLNAATPVGAVNNTVTSSGCIVPDSFSNLSVSECDHMGFAKTT